MKWHILLLVMLFLFSQNMMGKRLPHHYLFENIAFIDSTSQSINYHKLPTAEVPLLHRGLAHNDYWNTLPLMKALHHGYIYIEADIHLIKDELYVYHNRPLIVDKSRTLKQLYLQPLQKIFHERRGQIFPESNQTLYLLIDIKSNAKRTYTALKKQLIAFQEMLTTYEGEKISTRAITIIITGNRPVELMRQESFRMACVDGRIRDLDENYDPSLMPMISDRYAKVLGWTSRLSKTICEKNLQKLNHYIAQAHSQGKMFRLWNSPESEEVWTSLLSAGVDIINTDELERLQKYLIDRKEENIPVARN